MRCAQKEEPKKEAQPAPAEPSAKGTGEPTQEAVPEEGASVPSKVDIEEVATDDIPAPMDSSVNDMD